jgi:hypothetical protein
MERKFIRFSTITIGTAAARAALIFAAGPASAGELNGNGDPTQGPTHARSICVFSGLEDGEEDPNAPSGPGAPPQNWGHIPKELKPILTANGESPGDACNGHTGFFAGGGGEPPQ